MNNSGIFFKKYLIEIVHFNLKYILMVGILLMSCEDPITKSSDISDCDNKPNGSAIIDDCGLCTGGTTVFEFNYLMDCDGVCGGSALEDCTGICNGSEVLDECGECGGDNAPLTGTCDCNGIPFGDAYKDGCNICVGGTTGNEACPFDCAGIEEGTSWINHCNECVAEEDFSCIQGCDGNWSNDGSQLFYNDCGICGSDNSTGIVINEINYNSSDDYDPEDWVELYNSSENPINIGNWKFRDEINEHIFFIPENTILSACDFIVLCKDATLFTSLFPEITNYIGDLGFGLSSGGELVRLSDDNGELVDVVEYDNSFPWSTEPDGNGPTLELIHPSLDNSLPANWSASNINGGTPGIINSVYSADNSNSIFPGKVINEINYNSADE